jgi:hypothetical protein
VGTDQGFRLAEGAANEGGPAAAEGTIVVRIEECDHDIIREDREQAERARADPYVLPV